MHRYIRDSLDVSITLSSLTISLQNFKPNFKKSTLQFKIKKIRLYPTQKCLLKYVKILNSISLKWNDQQPLKTYAFKNI